MNNPGCFGSLDTLASINDKKSLAAEILELLLVTTPSSPTSKPYSDNIEETSGFSVINDCPSRVI